MFGFMWVFFCFGGGVLVFFVWFCWFCFCFLGVFCENPSMFILKSSDLLIRMLKREAGKNSPELLSCSVKRRQSNNIFM